MNHSLILLRHGESAWNAENRFTGWTDVDLTPAGEAEARHAADLIRAEGLIVDVAMTSVLKRSIRSTWIVLDALDRMWIPQICDWRLNERHYGALQGMNKADTAAQVGEEQVFRWRRGFADEPPALGWDDPRHPRFDPRYAHLPPEVLPATESLKATLARVIACWDDTIAAHLRAGRRVLVVAHGNSLRALVKHLDQIPDDQIAGLYIPTGFPIVYTLDESLAVLNRRILGDPAAVESATQAQLRRIRQKTGAS